MGKQNAHADLPSVAALFGFAVLSIEHVACLGSDIGGVVRKDFIFVRAGNASREELLLPACTVAEFSKKFC